MLLIFLMGADDWRNIMKSYIKLQGPPLDKGLQAMKKLAKDLPKLSKGAISEETIYDSKILMGEFDFVFSWKKKPAKKDLRILVFHIDEVMEEIDCRYSIVTKD